MEFWIMMRPRKLNEQEIELEYPYSPRREQSEPLDQCEQMTFHPIKLCATSTEPHIIKIIVRELYMTIELLHPEGTYRTGDLEMDAGSGQYSWRSSVGYSYEIPSCDEPHR
jgi:hypothetical protein